MRGRGSGEGAALELSLTVTGTDDTASGERGDACREDKKTGAGLSTPALCGARKEPEREMGKEVGMNHTAGSEGEQLSRC